MIEYFFVLVIGLIFGSFLNVLIYRIPLEISLLSPARSSCPKCQSPIKWYENIPIISYIFLNQKCSNCSKPISAMYPFIELLTGLLTALLYTKYLFNLELIVIVLLFYNLIVLSIIDLRFKSVPDYLLILAILLALIIGDLKNALIFMGIFSLL